MQTRNRIALRYAALTFLLIAIVFLVSEFWLRLSQPKVAVVVFITCFLVKIYFIDRDKRQNQSEHSKGYWIGKKTAGLLSRPAEVYLILYIFNFHLAATAFAALWAVLMAADFYFTCKQYREW